MINIELEDKIYKFPSDWGELTIGMFQEILKVKEDNDIEDAFKIVSILSGIAENDLDKLPYPEFLKLVDVSKFVFNESKSPISFELDIDNVTYKLIDDITKISVSEYIDLDRLLQEKEKTFENLHIILAILYRPKTNKGIETYNSDTVMERAAIFKQKMYCDKAIAAMLFTSAIGQSLLEHMLDSSIKSL